MKKPCPACAMMPNGERVYCEIEHERPDDTTHVGGRSEAEYQRIMQEYRAWKRRQKRRAG